MADEVKTPEEPKLVKLDIACGQNKAEGFIGMDQAALPGVDIVRDIETYPWPFEDNSVDEVVCRHYVEHTKDLMAFMNELHRVMKPGAKATIIAPYYSSVRAWQDPTHVRAISEMTFMYFNKEWRNVNGLNHYPINTDFDFVYGYNWDPMWAKRNEEARNFAAKHYINVILDILLTLTKR